MDWDQQIRSCTALIQSDRESVHNRAIAYNFRGNSYYAKGDNDRAITDYNGAIRLDPELCFNLPDNYSAVSYTHLDVYKRQG